MIKCLELACGHYASYPSFACLELALLAQRLPRCLLPAVLAYQDVAYRPLQVNLAGYPGHQCPLDEEGFLEFARNLPNPLICQTILRAKPVSSISAYSGTDNFRRLFEAAPPPSGLCVIGDAACYFNPVNVRTRW